MRIAWTGTAGSADASGVAGIAYLMLAGLAARGHSIDVFVASLGGAVDESVARLPGVTVVTHRTRWRWDRWYSRGHLRAFVSSSLERTRVQRALARRTLARHHERPYDVVFQMSQFESFFGRRVRSDPPLVVHPCSIALSEARWHRREWTIARGTEPTIKFWLVDLLLYARSALQRRHALKPELIVVPSHAFLRELAMCYGVEERACRVLRHPVDLDTFHCSSGPAAGQRERLLFISRMSSRKGLELIVELSHKLDDLAEEVEIVLIGGVTLWSDYSGLLAQLNTSVATYRGELERDEVLTELASAAMLLVPSRFEPGSIVTGEALAMGVPVIASSAVGPSEILTPRTGRVFADGDIDAFDVAVRDFLGEYRRNGSDLRAAARDLAKTELSKDRIVDQLETILLRVATRPSSP